MSTDAQVKQLDEDLNLFAELVVFDPKFAECAMRGRRELHTMVMGMRFQRGAYRGDAALLRADRLKRQRLDDEANKTSAPRCR